MSKGDNDQILNDIQKLQNIEKELFSSLENPQLQSAEIQKIISKINDISQMRLNLYKLLGSLNTNYSNNLTNSREVLSEQNVAVQIVEKELNRSKKRLAMIQEEKNNKIRLIEINTYYGQSYDEHANMMKMIIYILIPVIVVSILFKFNIIPRSIYFILNVIIILVGVVLLWNTYSKINMHDKLNYPEYTWPFDASTAPGPDSNANIYDPWSKLPSSCIGSVCCTSGTTFDAELGKCIPSPLTPQESFINMNMDQLNQVFTKHTSQFTKPDITMNSIIYPKNY
jgi:vacuolar-type H+-ATPase subunit I/STV1